MLRVYCDGVEVIATQVLPSPSAAEITFSSGAGLTFVSILVDEFRLSDGLIYGGAFTPPAEPFTSLPPPQPGAMLTISLESVRDGLASYQRHEWEVELV